MTQPTPPFQDTFNRADGPVGNNWHGPYWSINSGAVIHDSFPTLGPELYSNPGAEGVYVAGVAPDWAKRGADGTWSEENGIVHGGLAAQKFVGNLTNNVGVSPVVVPVVAGECYLTQTYIRNDGPGEVNVKRWSGNLDLQTVLPVTAGYVNFMTVTRGVANGTEAIAVTQKGIIAQTFYCDDFSLKSISASSLFLTRHYCAACAHISTVYTYGGYGRSGLVTDLDDPDNPQNFVYLTFNGTLLVLSKVINGVETVLFSISSTTLGGWIDGEILEIRKPSSYQYQIWYRGTQVGVTYDVTDPEITGSPNKHYGFYDATWLTTFKDFVAYTDDVPLPSFVGYTPVTYPAGDAVLSLRFDDGRLDDKTYLKPELDSRGLVAGFSLVRDLVEAANHLTLVDIAQFIADGHEIMCHSLTHGATPTDPVTYYQETAVASSHLRRLGFPIWSWVEPGPWVGAYSMDDWSKYGNAQDIVLMKYHLAYGAYMAPYDQTGCYFLPRSAASRHGVQHKVGDVASLIDLQGWVDTAIAIPASFEILFHSYNIDTGGYITAADFEAFLDYIEAKVALGVLTVLLPTDVLFATPV